MHLKYISATLNIYLYFFRYLLSFMNILELQFKIEIHSYFLIITYLIMHSVIF